MRCAALPPLARGLLALICYGLLAPASDEILAKEPPRMNTPSVPKVSVTRLSNNPIIKPEMLEGADGENINGPSLIAVPPWVKDPLGKYYLYFAHHDGKYIRLAYADKLEGPWKIHKPGVLQISVYPELSALSHIASPCAIVDAEKKVIRLYAHRGGMSKAEKDGAEDGGSLVATSSDGLGFTIQPGRIPAQYHSIFRYGSFWYSIAKGGASFRSADGMKDFAPIRLAFPPRDHPNRPRHCAALVHGDTLFVVCSFIPDEPERLLLAQFRLNGKDWTKGEWPAIGPFSELLRPETAYEGVNHPIQPSRSGKGTKLHELRDPAFFEEDGRIYLLYSVAGESGIAIAKFAVE